MAEYLKPALSIHDLYPLMEATCMCWKSTFIKLSWVRMLCLLEGLIILCRNQTPAFVQV